MEQTIRVMNCPCCKKLLYALEMYKSEKDAAWIVTKDSPTIQSDDEGHFMKCGNCSRRIAIEKASALGVERWMIASRQNCDRILP